jgi:pantetheine-phosphate adenylyltransferase
MVTNYLFPGSFCPPTYGHLAILKEAAEILPKITIVCSRNPQKSDYCFSEEECERLWKSYNLPQKISVCSFSDLVEEDLSKIVMVRGIRNERDFVDEAKIMKLNHSRYGIKSFCYVIADQNMQEISSSKARQLAKDLAIEELHRYVSPMVITALLEKVLKIKNLFLVVGPPGSGKSTLLRKLSRKYSNIVHINTDDFNQKLRPVAEKLFPNQDLIELALTKPVELTKILKNSWLDLLKKELQHVRENCNVFVEVAYGLQEDKKIFRFVGGKVIYVGCPIEKLKRRNNERGTVNYIPFIDQIPDWDQSFRLAKRYKLHIEHLDNNEPENHLINLERQVFKILKEGLKWQF